LHTVKALYFHNQLVLASYYIKISKHHSSPQSFWRAKKNGTIKCVALGGLQFLEATSAEVEMLYGTQDFDGFSHFPANQNLAGLTGLSHISKAVGVNEAKVLI